jgi:hypothetical protein
LEVLRGHAVPQAATESTALSTICAGVFRFGRLNPRALTGAVEICSSFFPIVALLKIRA